MIFEEIFPKHTLCWLGSVLYLRADNQKPEEMRMKKILVIQGGGRAKGNTAWVAMPAVTGSPVSRRTLLMTLCRR